MRRKRGRRRRNRRKVTNEILDFTVNSVCLFNILYETRKSSTLSTNPSSDLETHTHINNNAHRYHTKEVQRT